MHDCLKRYAHFGPQSTCRRFDQTRPSPSESIDNYKSGQSGHKKCATFRQKEGKAYEGWMMIELFVPQLLEKITSFID
jgi:hypothetical protein